MLYSLEDDCGASGKGVHMTIQELFHLVTKNIRWIILFTLVGAIATIVYTHAFMDDYYEAGTTLYIVSAQETQLSATDLTISEKLLADYREIIKSRRVLDATAAKMNRRIPASAVSASSVAGTHVIQLSVTAQSPEVAAEAANVITDEFVSVISTMLNTDNVSIIDPALQPIVPAGPKRLQYILLATIASAMLSVGVILAISFLDTSFHSTEDAEHALGIPVLASVPKYKPLKQILPAIQEE